MEFRKRDVLLFGGEFEPGIYLFGGGPANYEHPGRDSSTILLRLLTSLISYGADMFGLGTSAISAFTRTERDFCRYLSAKC